MGEILRQARQRAGATTRDIAYYSSGHISNVENGHATPSEDLIFQYVSLLGCDEGLARNALEEARKVIRERKMNRRREAFKEEVTPDSPYHVMRGLYSTVESEASFLLDENGAIRYVDVVRHVVAIRSEARYVTVRYGYPSDRRAGVLGVIASENCRVVTVREGRVGYLTAILELSRPIVPKDEPLIYSYRVAVSSAVRARPVIHYHAEPSSKRYSVRVQFHEECRPREIWWFRESGPFDAEGVADVRKMIPLNKNNFYYRDFRDVGGEYMGLAWRWA